MKAFFGIVSFILLGTFVGLQNIYFSVPGVNIYTVWFFALVIISGIVGMTTKQVRKGIVWGISLWIFALVVYEATLGLLQWIRWQYPFDTKSLIEGLILIAFVGIPVAWISSWLSVKSKTTYFGVAALSTAGVLVLSKTLISLYVSGVFGHWL